MRSPKIIAMCFCFMLLFMNTQCDDDEIQGSPCDQAVVIDQGFYESAETDDFTFQSAEIIDNCLAVVLSSSGCDGETWSMVLVDSGSVAESLPEQRFLKFVFSNNEECLAVITQERSFDISNLQVEGSNEIILNIDGFPESITYQY
ncbi:hypothetical protein [Psychroserpens sp.]|uniref:hypothetical protein n=1 Tax=Psychroserpens sp. TaxID=2020870 RepID=UPI001B07BFA2|nr:hypothetical protein [Psychroserpens sp.]MBO6605991.1 hypothetical protein [Psychroserpens sp.]MBO6632681.1 hypothetical protein [Psychroserpens sp.]MBO6652638.1 hypothetical protein [Psychroserpens sp.]MBO6681590.1 hypothetical protein [Psychroserpens sp.]MBO6749365.1 hypothetical protein [Psychroserpens sp.]